MIDVNAGSLSAANLLARINNTGGSIEGNASIDFEISGALTTTGDATFQIIRNSGEPSQSIIVNAGSISVGGNLTARCSKELIE